MDPFLAKRLIEATLFASSTPMEVRELQRLVGDGVDLDSVMEALAHDYEARGIHLEQTGTRFAFRTAPDLANLLTLEREEERKLSKAALETLAIIAYHQPVTRGDLEDLRGVAVARGTLDVLLELGWITPQGRRDAPGRPIEWATTAQFLDHFGLEGLDALPGVQDLRAAGLLDGNATQIYGVLEDTHLHEDDGEIDQEEAEAELRPDEVHTDETVHDETVHDEALHDQADTGEAGTGKTFRDESHGDDIHPGAFPPDEGPEV